MSNLAKEGNGALGITGFEFGGCRADVAEGTDAAASADGLAMTLRVANIEELAGPTFRETALTKVVAVLMRNDTDGKAAGGIDGAGLVTATTNIFLSGETAGEPLSQFFGQQLAVLGHSDGIQAIEGHCLFGG